MGAPRGKSLITTKERKSLEKLGRNIRKKRENNGWTLEDTEDHGFRTWQHWSAIELGKKNINYTTLLKVCKTLKIHPKDIFNQL